MKGLVIYDSVFGNTEKIARAIAEGLGNKKDVEVRHVKKIKAGEISDLAILVVGSPTRMFTATGAIKKLVKRMKSGSISGIKVAAFDTRFSKEEIKKAPAILRFLEKRFGYAAEPLLKKLLKKGGIAVHPAEGFIVTANEGPLLDGELERATAWGRSISLAKGASHE
jgi:flavodoxin I